MVFYSVIHTVPFCGTLSKNYPISNTKAYFYFNLDDGKKAIDVLRQTGKSWFYYGINGDQSMSGVFTEAFISKQVIAIYNKDGSIKQVVRMDGSNEKLKNCWITSKISNELYYLGNDGLPKTGLVAEPETGIKAIRQLDYVQFDNSIYDLQGRQLSSKPNKGIYIQNGKKIIIK